MRYLKKFNENLHPTLRIDHEDISYELIISDINYNLPINESSIAASNYKYRKNDLIPEVNDILFELEDYYGIRTKSFFRRQLSSDETISLMIELDCNWIDIINKNTITPTISHLINFLKNEKYELNSIYCESYIDNIFNGFNVETVDNIPDEIIFLKLEFEYAPAFIKYQK